MPTSRDDTGRPSQPPRTRAHAEVLGLTLMAATVALMLGSDSALVVADSPGPLARPLAMSENRPPVSDIIFPAQTIPLRFSHVQHLTGLDGYDALDCTTCHDTVEDSRSSLDRLIPGEEHCATCHEIDRSDPDKAVAQGEPPAACVACHVGVEESAASGGLTVPRVSIPTPYIKFDHGLHVRDQGIECARCHGDFTTERVGLASRAQLPSMSTCLSCHRSAARARGQTRGRSRLTECVTCHLADPGGVVRTSYPGGKLAPSGQLFGADHDALFRVSHESEAQNNTDYCEKCHKRTFCVDCHDGVVKPHDFHAGDYVNLHGVDARRNTLDCNACHRSQSFCTGCHSRTGVSSDPRGGSEYERDNPARRFHPEGWAVSGLRGQDHHSFQAQRNIKQCASCHREQFCVGCHGNTVDTMGIDPHPRGWAQSRRCRTLLASAGRMCLRCHVTLDDARCI